MRRRRSSPLSALLHFLSVFVDVTLIGIICISAVWSLVQVHIMYRLHFFISVVCVFSGFSEICNCRCWYSLDTPKKCDRFNNVSVLWVHLHDCYFLCILENKFIFSSLKCVWYRWGSYHLPPKKINICIINETNSLIRHPCWNREQ